VDFGMKKRKLPKRRNAAAKALANHKPKVIPNKKKNAKELTHDD
jgi:hypothetical protein